ncbi:hypothetical protein BP6252_08850 [Coleophoma cylindrospora]|uniref:Rhodopsin domain-containing protein n=1 Tax=Coleophoma cylindrospora TaxID=1849047 RepID=A0A3D8R7C2_9HELO|nr:hypothetical protein BP6252_08850 [Coleophoma cylindrospora]
MNNTVLPPFQVITDLDKGGLITIITTFFLSSVWICLSLRVYVRLKINGPWKWDDHFVAAATLLSSARSSIVYLEITHGYGSTIKLLSAEALANISKFLLADDILYILGLTVSKVAVAALCLRITTFRDHSPLIWATILLCILWGLSSVLLVIIDCSPESLRSEMGHCPNLAERWKAIGAIDVITEAALLVIPIFLLMRLQMSFRLKSIVFIAFGVRIPVIGLSMTHLHCILTEIRSPDPTLEGAQTASWAQIHLDLCILSTTLTCLGAFLSPFEKIPAAPTVDRSTVPFSTRSFRMQSISARSAKSTKSAKSSRWTSFSGTVTNIDFSTPILRTDTMPQKTVISSPRKSQRSFSQDSRQGIMMQREWEVHNASGTEQDLGIYLTEDPNRP